MISCIIYILNPYLVIWPYLLFYFQYPHIYRCERKLNYASAHVILDLISYMICHVTALVVISTAIFKGDTSLARLFLTTWKCLEQIFKTAVVTKIKGTHTDSLQNVDAIILLWMVLKRLFTIMQSRWLNTLCRHKQRFGKIDTIVVLHEDKDGDLLWSGLQWHQSCHRNEMTPLPILLAAVFLGTWKFYSKMVHGSFFLH